MLVEMNKKTYKMIEPPKGRRSGKWSILFKDRWLDVKSYGIKQELNVIYYKETERVSV